MTYLQEAKDLYAGSSSDDYFKFSTAALLISIAESLEKIAAAAKPIEVKVSNPWNGELVDGYQIPAGSGSRGKAQ